MTFQYSNNRFVFFFHFHCLNHSLLLSGDSYLRISCGAATKFALQTIHRFEYTNLAQLFYQKKKNMSQNNGSDRWMFVSLLSQFHLSQIVCALHPPDNQNMPTTQWCCARKSLILNGFISTAICANIVIEFVTGKLFKLPENGIYIRGGFIKRK